MNTTASPADAVTRGVRWLARGLGVVLAGTVVLFATGEDGLYGYVPTAPEAVQLALFFTAWLGLLLAWRWELLGAALTLGGMALFYVANYLSAGRWPSGWAFALLASPGVLFLYCGLRGWRARHRLVG